MKEKKIAIDLLKGIPNAENIFAISGRDLGFKQRKFHKLDEIENENNKIEIIIKDNIIFDEAIETAFEQIEEMKYEVSLKDYDKVIKMAIAFKGKKLRLETR